MKIRKCRIDGFANRAFMMGPHKAYQFARTLTKYDVAVFSDMDVDALKACQLRAAEPDSTVKKWVQEFGGTARVAVVTNVNVTYSFTLDEHAVRSSSSPTYTATRKWNEGTVPLVPNILNMGTASSRSVPIFLLPFADQKE